LVQRTSDKVNCPESKQEWVWVGRGEGRKEGRRERGRQGGKVSEMGICLKRFTFIVKLSIR